MFPFDDFIMPWLKRLKLLYNVCCLVWFMWNWKRRTTWGVLTWHPDICNQYDDIGQSVHIRGVAIPWCPSEFNWILIYKKVQTVNVVTWIIWWSYSSIVLDLYVIAPLRFWCLFGFTNRILELQLNILVYRRRLYILRCNLDMLSGFLIPTNHWTLESFVPDHRARVMHICGSKLVHHCFQIMGAPAQRHAIIWTNIGLLLIGPLVTKFCEHWIKIQQFLYEERYFKMPSVKWRHFRLVLNERTTEVEDIWTTWRSFWIPHW